MGSGLKHIISVITSLVVISSCSNSEERFYPHSLDDLRDVNLCVMEGSFQADYAEKNLKPQGVKLDYYPSFADCLMAVSMNQADAFLGSDIHTYNDAFRATDLEIAFVVPQLQFPTSYGVHKNNIELLNDLDSYIDSCETEGVLNEVRNRWFDAKNTDYHDCVVYPPVSEFNRQNGEPLIVGISGAKQPAEVLINNEWTGYEIELLQRYAESRGKSLKVMVFDFHNLIPALQSNTVDVIAATLTVTPERQEKINFTKEINKLEAVVIVKGDKVGQESFKDKVASSFYSSLVKENRWKLIMQGLQTTLIITLISLLLGVLIGGLICWMRMSNAIVLNKIASFYLYFMRNIPMLVFLMLMFYVFLAKTGLIPVIIAIIAFGMNSAAFISEIFRTGIMSVNNGQIEAGRGLGCSKLMTYRYIVIPQAIKHIVPIFKNECISLLKGTSIVGYISIVDLTKASDLIRSSSFEAFFPLIIITLIYFLLSTLLTWIIEKLMK